MLTSLSNGSDNVINGTNDFYPCMRPESLKVELFSSDRCMRQIVSLICFVYAPTSKIVNCSSAQVVIFRIALSIFSILKKNHFRRVTSVHESANKKGELEKLPYEQRLVEDFIRQGTHVQQFQYNQVIGLRFLGSRNFT